MKFLFAVEKFLVRNFGISLISWIVCRQAGVRPVPVFLMTTTGRKSGRKIETPIFYFLYREGFYVIASKGGAPHHPAWFLNLEANPEATVRVKGKDYRVRARVADGDERWALWDNAAIAYPTYNDYQKLAKARKIPVVVLEKVA